MTLYELLKKIINRIIPIRLGGTNADNVVDARKNLGFTNRELWKGAWWMHIPSGEHTPQKAYLKEPISRQALGITLVFSAYDISNGKALDYDWHSFFISKSLVEEWPGKGHTFNMASVGHGREGSKYLKIYDTYIEGYEQNNEKSTGSSISYDNRYYVLRYVYGV